MSNVTPEQQSAVRAAIAANQSAQIDASTDRQALEERIAARAYELYLATPRKERKPLSHYAEIAERELASAPGPKAKPAQKSAPAPAAAE